VGKCISISGVSLSLSLSLSLLILQSASAENIVSRPVGFLRISVPSNSQFLASQPFSAFDETNSQHVLRWDASSGYVSSSTVVESGAGFWLINQESTNRDVFLAGEVALSPSNTAMLDPGLNLVGYPYSGPVRLDETELLKLTNSVQILNAQAEEPNPAELAMGKGYWVKSLSEECIVWTEIRPYENVFPEDGLPDIEAIATKDGSSVALSIACEGSELFDVFYQDFNPTSRLDTARNWRVAEAGLPANGQTSIEWSDTGSGDRPAPGKILGRYYLVGRADVDLNGNGIPDAREQFVNGANPVTETAAAGSVLADDALIEEAEESTFTNSESEVEDAGLTNKEPVQVISVGRVIYVDRRLGDDRCSGLAMAVVGMDGPKKTISAGLGTAGQGDVLVIKEGHYAEDLNLEGRDLNVRIEGNVDLSGAVRQTPRIPLNVLPEPVDVHTNGLSE
jgi:hypothetical protein